MSSILLFLRNFLGSSSPESDVSKYVELLNDTQVNQLNFFPGNSKTYQFNINDLQHEDTIFTNNNAVIEHYVFRPLKFSLVAKIIQFPIYRRIINEERLKALIQEVKIFRKISHGANITDFYGYALYNKKVWIFMELMEVSLEELYRYFHEKLYPELRFSKEIVIPENVVGVIAVRMLDALVFCKEQGVMHRDVKPKNVLVNKKGEVKFCDFGASKILELGSKTNTFKGTLPYIPPERFKDDQPYDDRTDIWSLGITLVEIVYGDIPYKGLHLEDDCTKIADIIKNADGNKIMSQCFSEKYSKELHSFTRSCLNELSLRPRYSELKETILYKSFVAKNDNNNTMKFFITIYTESLNIENNSLDAKAYYNRGLAQQELKADYADAYYNRGTAQYGLGKYNEAIADYTKAIELNPTYANAYNNRGIAQYNLGKYNEAIADCTKAIELDPTDAIAYNNRGNAQNSLGKYNEAITDFTKAIELNPTYANAYSNRGSVQVSLGKYNEAIADYAKACELDPMLFTKSESWKRFILSATTIADYTKAIELDPTYANAYNSRGLAQKNLGKYNEAIADCTKAIELNPTLAYAYSNRGYAQIGIGKYNEAIADCTKAIELDPILAYAYSNRGYAQYGLGKYNEAIADCAKAIELDPMLITKTESWKKFILSTTTMTPRKEESDFDLD